MPNVSSDILMVRQRLAEIAREADDGRVLNRLRNADFELGQAQAWLEMHGHHRPVDAVERTVDDRGVERSAPPIVDRRRGRPLGARTPRS